MATKVKALTTLMGGYGKAYADDILELRSKDAKALSDQGLVEIIGETDTDEKDFVGANLTKPKKEADVTITDNTGKPSEKAEDDTDKKNPTGAKATVKATASKTGKK
jgi:hypothetical protein